MFLTSACSVFSSSLPPKKEPTGLELQIQASDTNNPDEQGRAAPIMVRIYELKSTSTFDSADFFSLQKKGKDVLGADALATDEFILRPGDSQEITRRANPETTAIGVLAGFRDLGKAVWRAKWKVKPAPDAAWYRAFSSYQKTRLKISLDKQTITITDLDKEE